jgi:hypothetical protein
MQQFFSFAAQNELDLIVEADPPAGLEQLTYALVEPTPVSPVYPTSNRLLVIRAGSPWNSHRDWGIIE